MTRHDNALVSVDSLINVCGFPTSNPLNLQVHAAVGLPDCAFIPILSIYHFQVSVNPLERHDSSHYKPHRPQNKTARRFDIAVHLTKSISTLLKNIQAVNSVSIASISMYRLSRISSQLMSLEAQFLIRK